MPIFWLSKKRVENIFYPLAFYSSFEASFTVILATAGRDTGANRIAPPTAPIVKPILVIFLKMSGL